MTDWDERWKAGDTPWDKGAPAPAIGEFFTEFGRRFFQGKMLLAPGCGSGNDVRGLSGLGAKVMGLDLSPRAVETAREQRSTEEEVYEVGDFFEWQHPPFDLIWEHTCFCAIDPADRPRYAAAAKRLLKPGGMLFGVFFLNPWDEGETPKPPPFASSREEIIETLGPELELKWEKFPQSAFPGREGKEWLAVFARGGG